jgi:hypothetical protein
VSAARAKILFGEEGIRIYAWTTMINTSICTFFGVYASKVFKNVFQSIMIGSTLIVLGMGLLVASNISVYHYLIGSFIYTAGEVIYAAVAQYALMTSIPKTKNENSIYSFALTTQNCGRVLGVSLAFPLGVSADLGVWFIGICFVVMVSTMIYARPLIQRDFADGTK